MSHSHIQHLQHAALNQLDMRAVGVERQESLVEIECGFRATLKDLCASRNDRVVRPHADRIDFDGGSSVESLQIAEQEVWMVDLPGHWDEERRREKLVRLYTLPYCDTLWASPP
jgi:hypothetical protein